MNYGVISFLLTNSSRQPLISCLTCPGSSFIICKTGDVNGRVILILYYVCCISFPYFQSPPQAFPRVNNQLGGKDCLGCGPTHFTRHWLKIRALGCFVHTFLTNGRGLAVQNSV